MSETNKNCLWATTSTNINNASSCGTYCTTMYIILHRKAGQIFVLYIAICLEY